MRKRTLALQADELKLQRKIREQAEERRLIQEKKEATMRRTQAVCQKKIAMKKKYFMEKQELFINVNNRCNNLLQDVFF